MNRALRSFLRLPSCLTLLGCSELFLLGPLVARSADRCADARDDIRRAKAMGESDRQAEARTLLLSALFACPANPQNLDLLAEAYDSLGELAQAGTLREQAMRLRGVSAKPWVEFTAASHAIERGQTTQLSWNTANASAVEIAPDLGRVPARGTKTVAPMAGVTYQLTARGPGGISSASVEITVTLSRLTEANILELLKNEVPQTRVAKLAAERGIAFAVSAEAERRLRAAGAEDALIEVLKKAPH